MDKENLTFGETEIESIDSTAIKNLNLTNL